MIVEGRCDGGFTWNPSTCEYEYDKSSDAGEYFDYVNCKCRKRLIDKLVEECREDIDGNEMVYNAISYDLGLKGRVCRSCARYVILLIITCIMIMSISVACFYFYRYTKGNYVNPLSY